MRMSLLVGVGMALLCLTQVHAAPAKKETKRKPSSMKVLTKADLAKRISIERNAVPNDADRYCAIITTNKGMGNATKAIFYSQSFSSDLGFTSDNGMGTCTVVDRVFSIRERIEFQSKKMPSAWAKCYNIYRTGVGEVGGDAIEGVPTDENLYREAGGEFSNSSVDAMWDCGDLKM